MTTEKKPTNKLYQALSKAQGEMTNPKKDSEAGAGTRFNYKYTQLDQIIEIARPVLAKNGLGIIQSPITENNPEGHYVGITTTIIHDSGETFSSHYMTKQMNPGPQEMGSLLTYMRRYAYLGAVGIHPEDEDDDAKSVQPNNTVTASFTKKAGNKIIKDAKAIDGEEVFKKPTFTLDSLNKEIEVANGSTDALFSWGKFKGKKVSEVPLEELVGYFKYLKSRDNYDPTKFPALFKAIQERCDQYAH